MREWIKEDVKNQGRPIRELEKELLQAQKGHCVMPEACAGENARWWLQVINPKAHSLKEVKKLEKGSPQKSSIQGKGE